MKVQFSDNAFLPGPRAVAPQPPPAGKDFAGVLASKTGDTDAVKKTAETVKKTADTVRKTGDDVATKAKPHAPKRERIEDVPGHAYDEVVAGPRNGMMINDSGNARHGQAFVLVERDGRSFHIYGTGKERKIFEVGREPEPKPAPTKKTTSQTGAAIADA